jgi:hypothetical protein
MYVLANAISTGRHTPHVSAKGVHVPVLKDTGRLPVLVHVHVPY